MAGRQPSPAAGRLEFLGILLKGLVTQVLCSAVIGWTFWILQLMCGAGELGRQVSGSTNRRIPGREEAGNTSSICP